MIKKKKRPFSEMKWSVDASSGSNKRKMNFSGTCAYWNSDLTSLRNYTEDGKEEFSVLFLHL